MVKIKPTLFIEYDSKWLKVSEQIFNLTSTQRNLESNNDKQRFIQKTDKN